MNRHPNVVKVAELCPKHPTVSRTSCVVSQPTVFVLFLRRTYVWGVALKLIWHMEQAVYKL